MSLIEVMVAVALLGIMAAIAVPSLLPMRERAILSGETETVVQLIARARIEAMTRKRCVRVDVGNTLALQMLDHPDCESGGAPLVTIARHVVDPKIAVAAVAPFPASLPAGNITFRPTGRVLGTDRDRSNDAAGVRISGLAGETNVLVQGNGLVCVLRGRVTFPTGAAGPRCP